MSRWKHSYSRGTRVSTVRIEYRSYSILLNVFKRTGETCGSPLLKSFIAQYHEFISTVMQSERL